MLSPVFPRGLFGGIGRWGGKRAGVVFSLRSAVSRRGRGLLPEGWLRQRKLLSSGAARWSGVGSPEG